MGAAVSRARLSTPSFLGGAEAGLDRFDAEELKGDLRRLGAGIEVSGRLPSCYLLGKEPQPAPAESHRSVADRPRMGVELADSGDEEASPAEHPASA